MLGTFQTTLDSGNAKVYAGSVPADADTAISGQTLLATLPLGATSFSISNNVATLSGTPTEVAVADGTATFVRFETSGGTAVMDAVIGSDVSINDSAVVTDNDVTISSLTVTLPKS